MKSIRALILVTFLSLVFTPAVSSANSKLKAIACQAAMEELKRGPQVKIYDGAIVGGIFICTSCNGAVIANKVDIDSGVSCPGCGDPFSKEDQEFPPPNEADPADGNLIVPKAVLMTDPHSVTLFRSGTSWVCASCTTKNFDTKNSCVKCGNSKEEGVNAERAERSRARSTSQRPTILPTEVFEAAAATTAAPQTATVVNLSGQTEQIFQTYSVNAQTGGSANSPAARTLAIRISSAVVAVAISGGLGGWWVNSMVNPGPLVGEIADKRVEIVIFENRAKFEQLKNVVLDLAKPPQGVTVVASQGDQKPNFSNTNQQAYVVQKQYFIIDVAGQTITMDVNAQQYANWAVGSKVELSVVTASRYMLNTPRTEK